MVGTTLQFMKTNDHKGRVSKNTQRPCKLRYPNSEQIGLFGDFIYKYNKNRIGSYASKNWSKNR